MIYNKFKGAVLIAILSAAFTVGAAAQVMADFSTYPSQYYSESWTLDFSSGSYAQVTSGSTNGLLYVFLDTPVAVTSTDVFGYASRLDAGDQSGVFNIQFFDASDTEIFTAVVVTTGWSEGIWQTGSVGLTASSATTSSNITYLSLSGSGAIGNNFRMSFDTIAIGSVAVPEPASTGVILGLGVLGALVLRRKRRIC